MADIVNGFVKGLFGGQKPVKAPVAGDDDFADYAGAPEPTPAAISSFTDAASQAAPTSTLGQRPYTAWYRVWERTTMEDFKLEMYILPFLLVLIAVHVWGTKRNRTKAKAWIKAHAPVLTQEFVQVGYTRPQASAEDVTGMGADMAAQQALEKAQNPDNMLREKKADEYQTYATGRQNVAFVDFKLTLAKRFNPFMRLGEHLIPLFFESFPAPQERLEATAYVFDGQETKVAPAYGKGDAKKVPNSTFDGFVFAVVHKDVMKRLRDERYDLSLTTTRDHAKLPVWTTVMSESAEVTDTLLTPELIKAVNEAGDSFEALVVSDQPMDQPKTLDDTKPRKRINLSLKLTNDHASTLPIFTYFLRLPDQLVSAAHFRPEALRRIRQTREEQIAKIRKADDEEKAEERKLAADKLKREQRDAKLGRLSADEQRKFLEKERERNAKKGMKRSTIKA
ncbi:Nn.00g106300.m01.CDS01 [Neocucurbitaria sp. VM-36]